MEYNIGSQGDLKIVKKQWNINPLSEAVLDQEIVAVFDEPSAKTELTSAVEEGGGKEEDDTSSIKACWDPTDQREEVAQPLPEVIASNLMKWQSSSKRDRSGSERKSGTLVDIEKEERRVRAILGTQIRCVGRGSRFPPDLQDEHPILIHELTQRFPNCDKVSSS